MAFSKEPLFLAERVMLLTSILSGYLADPENLTLGAQKPYDSQDMMMGCRSAATRQPRRHFQDTGDDGARSPAPGPLDAFPSCGGFAKNAWRLGS